MNLQDVLTTYAVAQAPRIQARPQPAPTRTLADFLRAHVVPAQQRGLEALAYTAALDLARVLGFPLRGFAKADTVAKRKAILLARYGKGAKR